MFLYYMRACVRACVKYIFYNLYTFVCVYVCVYTRARDIPFNKIHYEIKPLTQVIYSSSLNCSINFSLLVNY